MEALIEIKDLTIGYHRKGNDKVVHKNINGGLYPGELTCLLGPNGAGKSTLLRTLCGFQPALGGDVYIDGLALRETSFEELAKRIGVVLTEKVNIQNITVQEMVSYGRSPYTGFFGKLTEEDKEKVIEAMKKVGISHMKDRLLQNLSDGERQKVMIAKALVQETPVIFLDEPAAFLDLPSKVELMQLLHRLTTDTGKVIFISTHDLDLALQTADKIWLMGEGKEIKTGVPEDLIINDEIKGFFEREGIYFDKRTGLFKIRNKHYKKIEVSGHGFEYTLLRRALSRNGIEPGHHINAKQRIEIIHGDNPEFMVYDDGQISGKYHTIEEVIRAVK
jgi:iron complex transport system ATP-binding protein